MRSGKLLWTFMLIFLQMSYGRGELYITPVAATTPSPATGRSETATPAATQPASRGKAMEDKLMATWIAEDVDAKIGDVKIKLIFRKESQMKLAP